MLGVQIGEIIHAIHMSFVFIFMLFMASKMVDPSTLEVGSPEWAEYVRTQYRNIHW